MQIPIRFLFAGVFTKHTFNASYPNNIKITPFSWTGNFIRVNLESRSCYGVVGVNPTVELNVFDKYAVHVLITRDTESGESDINKFGRNYKTKRIITPSVMQA